MGPRTITKRNDDPMGSDGACGPRWVSHDDPKGRHVGDLIEVFGMNDCLRINMTDHILDRPTSAAVTLSPAAALAFGEEVVRLARGCLQTKASGK